MIVCCSSCATRYTLPPLETDAPLAITCRTCGHRWKEATALVQTIDAIDISEEPRRSTLPRVIDHDDAPDHEALRLAELARDAQARFAEEQARRAGRRRAWAVFAALVVSPVIAAAALPEQVVAAAPISIKAYQALGYDVNLYGLEVRRVERQHVIVNGTRVLSVKGEISNISAGTRKLPWLRFALTGADGKELYAWTLDTGARPLRASETTSFVTRVAAPPEEAQNLKIRFARADEIGLNAGHEPQPAEPTEPAQPHD